MADLSIRTQAVLDRADLTLEYAATMTWKAIVGLPNSSATVANEIKGHECFGMSSDDLRQMVDDYIGPDLLLAMSFLSDAQEILAAAGDIIGNDKINGTFIYKEAHERARQYINRAKWIIGEKL